MRYGEMHGMDERGAFVASATYLDTFDFPFRVGHLLFERVRYATSCRIHIFVSVVLKAVVLLVVELKNTTIDPEE